MDDSEEWPAISHQAVISAQLLKLHRDDDGMKSYNRGDINTSAYLSDRGVNCILNLLIVFYQQVSINVYI